MQKTPSCASRPWQISRRSALRALSAVAFGGSASGWLEALAETTATNIGRRRSCILLWMSGGPSQIDTFDMKPGHANGGAFKQIQTSVPGIGICEHLPKLSKWMHDVAIIRSMKTKEGDHSRATYLLRTGRLPQGPIQYPALGSVVGKEYGDVQADLPSFVSVAPNRFLSPASYGPGFLGARYAPVVVGEMGYSPSNDANVLRVRNLSRPDDVSHDRMATRLKLWSQQEDAFSSEHPDSVVGSHRIAYDRAVRMMREDTKKAFELENEPEALRNAYGRNYFGQGCLLARWLVERGIPFVEVSLNGLMGSQVFGWDTHTQNFDQVRKLCEVLDPAWSTLMQDLKNRGMLESTTIVWMGEFGRTPRINRIGGRDHFPGAWSVAMAGGGIRGGQVHGRTSKSGMAVEDNPVSVPDLLATVCHAIGVDPMRENMSNIGRPIRLVEPDASPIKEVLS